MHFLPAIDVHTVNVRGTSDVLEHDLNAVNMAVEGGTMEGGPLCDEVMH